VGQRYVSPFSEAPERSIRARIAQSGVEVDMSSRHHSRHLREAREVGSMTITVYGAGAIGGVTGAMLARAGHDVLLVDRAEDHVAAMNAHGPTIESRGASATV